MASSARAFGTAELLLIIVESATPREILKIQRVSKAFCAAATTVLRSPAIQEALFRKPSAAHGPLFWFDNKTLADGSSACATTPILPAPANALCDNPNEEIIFGLLKTHPLLFAKYPARKERSYKLWRNLFFSVSPAVLEASFAAMDSYLTQPPRTSVTVRWVLGPDQMQDEDVTVEQTINKANGVKFQHVVAAFRGHPKPWQEGWGPDWQRSCVLLRDGMELGVEKDLVGAKVEEWEMGSVYLVSLNCD
ncbi:hypothetical protein LTR08_003668 [Meristemomyces frigidus]|nr:hypothetical protein LTR08_003668 [Meristemomyces frigidus]